MLATDCSTKRASWPLAERHRCHTELESADQPEGGWSRDRRSLFHPGCVDWSHPHNDADTGHPVTEHVTAGQRIRTTPGHAQHREAADAKLVGRLSHIPRT